MVRKFISVSMAVVMGLSMAVPAQAEEWTEWQVKSHQIADMAREMGLPEENPIIKECGRIWWEEAVRLNREAEERAEQEALTQAFIDEHYADAVDMAGVIYAEARGLNTMEQSMVCWCILNRYDSGRFGKTIHDVIWAKSQFAHSSKTVSDNGTDLIWLAQDVLKRWYMESNGAADVGRTLPKDYCYYYGNGKHNLFRKTNSGKGRYNFGLADPYK